MMSVALRDDTKNGCVADCKRVIGLISGTFFEYQIRLNQGEPPFVIAESQCP